MLVYLHISLSLSLSIYIYIYVHVCIYIYIYIYTYHTWGQSFGGAHSEGAGRAPRRRALQYSRV